MKVALEVSGLLGPLGGISVYIRELLSHLPAVSEEFEFMFYGCFWRDFDRRVRELRLPNNHEHLFRRLPQSLLLPLEYRLGIAVEEGFLRRHGVDLFHATGQWLPICRNIKTVLTVHQEADREDYSADAHEYFELTKVFPQAVRAASHLIAVSDTTRRFLQDKFRIPDERITIIHHAPPDILLSSEHEEQYQGWAESTGLHDPYILCVAHLNPRKNILTLLDAFQRFLQQTHSSTKLVLAGRKDTLYSLLVSQDIAKRGLVSRVILTGEIYDRAFLCELYQHASMLCFPSLTESFGIPVIEAMRYDCPVITSDIPVMLEIAGDAALFVPSRDPEAISAAMVRMFTEPSLRENLISKGRARAQLFNWRMAAIKTAAVYKKVLAQ